MAQIPVSEVTFHPHSHGDPAGQLFRWNGELYRGIRAQWAPFFTGLFQTGVIQRLVDRGLLIETEPTPFILDGFALVVHHRTVMFASYAEEWCAPMLQDAALSIVELLTELAPLGLTLKDGHPWNVLFERGRFIYVDFTSLIPYNGNSPWPGCDSFRRFCLYPLLLMSLGHERIARRMLPEYEGIRKSELLLLRGSSVRLGTASFAKSRARSFLRQRVPEPYRRLVKSGVQSVLSLLRVGAVKPKSPLSSLLALRHEVESIVLPVDCDLGNSVVPMEASQAASTARERAVYRVLSDLRPESVLDMNSGDGGRSRLAASLNSRVVAFDADSSRVSQLYRESRNGKLSILPLVMDFTDPTPARGLFGHRAIAASDRFQCDMVVALSLVHDAVFTRHQDFCHIVGGLAQFSKRWLVVEFVPPEDPQLSEMSSDILSWYTLANFITSLRQRFPKVTSMPFHPDPGVLLLCER